MNLEQAISGYIQYKKKLKVDASEEQELKDEYEKQLSQQKETINVSRAQKLLNSHKNIIERISKTERNRQSLKEFEEQIREHLGPLKNKRISYEGYVFHLEGNKVICTLVR